MADTVKRFRPSIKHDHESGLTSSCVEESATGGYVTFADYDQLRQRVAEVEKKHDAASRFASDALMDLKRTTAKLALAEQDARRLDWLEAHPNELRFEPFSRSGQAWACCPSTKIGNDGRPHSYVDRFATARAAIDAAIASQVD